jgi:serine/threonine-protein kinase
LAKVLKKMLEITVKHRYKSAQEVLDAMAMAPYDEGMQQSMTTMITGFSPAPSTGINTGVVSRSTKSQSFGQPNTNISTEMTVSAINTEVGSPVSTSIRAGAAAPVGNVGYNIAQNQPVNRRRSSSTSNSSSETSIKKPTKWNAKNILIAYEKGRRDFAQQELNDLDLNKAFLPGISFYESKLSRANLQGTELSRADFGRANLSQTIMKNANLTEAYLGYADLSGADLRGANLFGANLKYANLQGANLCGVDLSSAQVTEAQLASAKTNWRTVMPSGKRGSW